MKKFSKIPVKEEIEFLLGISIGRQFFTKEDFLKLSQSQKKIALQSTYAIVNRMISELEYLKYLTDNKVVAKFSTYWQELKQELNNYETI